MGIEGIDDLKPGESYQRSDGNISCGHCMKPYWKHPKETKYDSFNGEEMSLVRICDGRLLKL